MRPQKVKAIALITGAICAASLLTPAELRADEARQVLSADVAKALKDITANGARPGAVDARVHIFPTIDAAANVPRSVLNRSNFYGFKPGAISPAGEGGNTPAFSPSFSAPFHWSPVTLYKNGGNGLNTVGVTSANQTNIYLNCPTHNDGCWGNSLGSIPTFQSRLNASTFIHIVDQYVGSTALNRYPQSPFYWWWDDPSLPRANWNSSVPVLLDSIAQAIVDAVATRSGNQFGYGYVYHVFVPQGTDVCMDSGMTNCYSPDHGPTFYFCGYHGSFTDGSGNHIMYSVEPYDPVPGCMEGGMSKTDAQANVLSHETFEWITDPDPNYQWNTRYYGEIGDACAWGSVAHLYLSGTPYNIQEEFTDVSQTCWKQASN